MRRRNPVVTAVLVALTLVLVASFSTACTSDKDSGPESTEPLAVASTIHISDGQFDPRTVEIEVGGVVMWINDDVTAHQLESVSGGKIHSGRLRAGGSYTQTFGAPGEYQYYCAIHNTMKGTIIVKSVPNDSVGR
jgi:plastocyanin